MIYTGTGWYMHALTELSIAVPSTTATPFDIFIDYNAGTPVLKVTDWTNVTTRATALTTQDGILVQTGNTDWKYLGTGRTTSVSGQCEDSRATRFLWNYYNKITREARYSIGTVRNWTYATVKTWRQANADATAKVEIVCGVLEDSIYLSLVSSCTVANGTWGSVAIGENSTSSPHADGTRQGGGVDNTTWVPFASTLSTVPAAIGYTYFSWLEWSSGATVKFYNYASDDQFRAGLMGMWKC
jgi:hypothetical protein